QKEKNEQKYVRFFLFVLSCIYRKIFKQHNYFLVIWVLFCAVGTKMCRIENYLFLRNNREEV
ncbi:hypothetical protein P4T70_18520, partial [Bacillus mobilis]|uniref:hypothetical protein n=1 Tax=Bacillus mobilis TaxID=2026190 RepID=UPI002E1C8B0C|nr:hypothetical protein [Bacillus mobilis]